MRLFIEPMEPLMFRTGRPFEAGQNNFAESLFPPTPETMQGAVRAAIATYWDANKNIAAAFEDSELTERIGDRNGYGRFRLTGIALGRYCKEQKETVERLFPPPAHIMRRESDGRLLRLLPQQVAETVQNNLPEGIHYFLEPQEKPNDDLKPVEGWLTEADLQKALGKDDLSGIEIVCKDKIYQKEPRLGIGLERGTKATAEGYLYQMLMIRMNHQPAQDHIYGFVVDIDLVPRSPGDQALNDEQIQKELHLPSSGWMTLGGEQRAAHFRVLPSAPRLTANTGRGHILLYLATPAVFDTGWKPSPQFAPLDAPLTAAINRYESIGGWRLNPGDARGENKVMRRCVPAGSVYFFDETLYEKKEQKQPLTDYGMEIGYGITYEGEW